MANLQVFLRDNNDERVGKLTQFESLEATAEYNASGSFTISTTTANPKLAMLTQKGAGIIIQRDDNVIFSGPIWLVEEEWSKDENRDKLRITGISDTGLLATRLVIPEPASLAPPYNTDAYHRETGVGSTVLYNYINKHLGPGARPVRRFQGITMATDPTLGNTITSDGRYENLLDFIQVEAIKAGDLGVEILNKEVRIYQPTDKSETIAFSKGLGNLAYYKLTARYPKVNYVFAAGANTGTSREIVERSDNYSINTYDVFEGFVSEEKSDTSQLQDSADALITKDGAKYSLTIEPTEDSGIQFQVDYKLGDTISARIRTQEFSETIRQVKISMNSEGNKIRPVLGTFGSVKNEILSRMIFRDRDLFTRVRTLEST